MKKKRVLSVQSLKEIMKKKILGTSNAWSTSRLSHQPTKTAYNIVDCCILRNYWKQLQLAVAQKTLK